MRQATIQNAETLLEEKEREKASYFDKLLRLKGASLQTLAYDYTYWDEMVSFVETGDPGWEHWDPSHPVRVFGEGDPHTVYGPRDRELALWAADPTSTTPADPTAAATASPLRGTELRSVVRRLRLPGAVRRH